MPYTLAITPSLRTGPQRTTTDNSADGMTKGRQDGAKTLTRQEQNGSQYYSCQRLTWSPGRRDLLATVQSVIPFTTQEADRVFQRPVLKRHMLKSRAAYRDK